MSERVTFFIDGTNLFFGLRKDLQRLDLDFPKLIQKILNGRTLSRVYYYAVVPEHAGSEADIDRRQKQLYFWTRCAICRTSRSSWGGWFCTTVLTLKKAWTFALAVDMLDLQSTYETAVLISGDSDFCRAVEVVKRAGKNVENATTRTLSSRELQQACDVYHLLDEEFLKDCWRYKNTKGLWSVKFLDYEMTTSILESEILEQPAVLRRLLAQGAERARELIAPLRGRFHYIIIAARGSSDNAARYAQYLFQIVNRILSRWLRLRSSRYTRSPQLEGALVLGISQSGKSPDVVSVLDAGRAQGRPTLAITNIPASPLEEARRLHAGTRRGTRAFGPGRDQDVYLLLWRR
jgi:uncharacterized LabA/DUF88 family protein